MSYLENCTLLYVEDDAEIVDIFSSALKERVKELYIATDGQEGLELYKKHSPDLILTDIVMPNMDGLKMSKEIKTLNQSQLIVLLTAYDDKNHFLESIEVGVSRYILKPIVDLKKLFSTLEELSKIFYLQEVEKEKAQVVLKENRINAVTSILHNISHQYRQPLSIISTHASTLKMDMEFGEKIDDEKLAESLDEIIRNTKYLSEVIEQSIRFFNSFDFDKEDISTEGIIENIKEYFKEDIEKYNIKIENSLLSSESIKSDKMLLSMVLQSIIRNSIDAISLNPKEKNYISISSLSEDGKTSFVVQDSGGGIEGSILDKVFDPYFTTKHEYIGVGLSLYMAYQIIKHHLGGEISVVNSPFIIENQEFYGAKFTIRL